MCIWFVSYKSPRSSIDCVQVAPLGLGCRGHPKWHLAADHPWGGIRWLIFECSFDDLLAGCASFCVVCCVDEIDQDCWHVLWWLYAWWDSWDCQHVWFYTIWMWIFCTLFGGYFKWLPLWPLKGDAFFVVVLGFLLVPWHAVFPWCLNWDNPKQSWSDTKFAVKYLWTYDPFSCIYCMYTHVDILCIHVNSFRVNCKSL